jgi:hypothetical protein
MTKVPVSGRVKVRTRQPSFCINDNISKVLRDAFCSLFYPGCVVDPFQTASHHSTLKVEMGSDILGHAEHLAVRAVGGTEDTAPFHPGTKEDQVAGIAGNEAT